MIYDRNWLAAIFKSNLELYSEQEVRLKGGESYCPCCVEQRKIRKTNIFREARVPMYPNYVFLRNDGISYKAARQIPGYLACLMDGAHFAIIQDEEIKSIRVFEEEYKHLFLTKFSTDEIKQNDGCEIIGGAFKGKSCVVDNVFQSKARVSIVNTNSLQTVQISLLLLRKLA